MQLYRSTSNCHVEWTFDAAAVVDIGPHGVDLRAKNKKHFRKAKSNKN
jgi:hypothetical protein